MSDPAKHGLDPRLLNDLGAGRWFAVERLEHLTRAWSPAERARCARALVEQLSALGRQARPPSGRDPRAPLLLALGILGDAVALPGLVAGLRDEDFAVRRAAIQGLGHLGDPGGVEPLLEALEWALADRATLRPHVVVDALGRLGACDPERIVPRLLDLLEGGVLPDLELAALAALRRIGDPQAVEPLAYVLHTHGDFRHRREAARALAGMEHPDALPALVVGLSDRHREVRQAAATALGQHGDARAVEPLQAAYLTERVSRVRASIEAALAQLDARPPDADEPAPLPWFGSAWQPDRPLET